MGKYILGIDQSTQGTKALLFDEEGMMACRTDLPHRQIVNQDGWVSHDPEEIYKNVIAAVKNLLEKSRVDPGRIIGVGISNQRETSLSWERESGKAVTDAIVWQCSRAKEICDRIFAMGHSELIRTRTGMNLSPYFPASKIAWILENIEGAKELADAGKLCYGTVDAWLVFRLTCGKSYKTDYSNASRTQLYNIMELRWDSEICKLFGINPEYLPEVCDSNSCFGYTDFEGILNHEIPIHGVLGDSHGALFGQGCLKKGMVKTTYGTGSSIMMNIGETPVLSSHGVVTSLAWGMDGKVEYVLEGNINYTGATITWLKDDLNMISSAGETEVMANAACQDDNVYLVPAFTGLGAPYWDSHAEAVICGLNRTSRKAEIVRAGLESIAYQIADVVLAMGADAKLEMKELRVDGGPTRNRYLMQFQSDILGIKVVVPEAEELSGFGAVYAAGLALKLYNHRIFEKMKRTDFVPEMAEQLKNKKYAGWKKAVAMILTK